MPFRAVKKIINVILNNFDDICLRNDNEAGCHLPLGDMLKEPIV